MARRADGSAATSHNRDAGVVSAEAVKHSGPHNNRTYDNGEEYRYAGVADGGNGFGIIQLPVVVDDVHERQEERL